MLPEEYKQVIDANTAPNKETIVNYNNVMIDGSAQEEALKKAFARFKNLDEQAQLKKDFNLSLKMTIGLNQKRFTEYFRKNMA